MSDQPSTPPQDRRSFGAREAHDTLQAHALEDDEPDAHEEADEPGRDAGRSRRRRQPS